ncbi:unnamed protein product [Anisakis simplex]|uniref:40S ribosomal protein S30 n=1 Tax=Anisakis simplex TaxID=6269 RepID=A0A158PN18_ANISI|nr:unnamed protein product [Anisakis simplex]
MSCPRKEENNVRNKRKGAQFVFEYLEFDEPRARQFLRMIAGRIRKSRIERKKRLAFSRKVRQQERIISLQSCSHIAPSNDLPSDGHVQSERGDRQLAARIGDTESISLPNAGRSDGEQRGEINVNFIDSGNHSNCDVFNCSSVKLVALLPSDEVSNNSKLSSDIAQKVLQTWHIQSKPATTTNPTPLFNADVHSKEHSNSLQPLSPLWRQNDSQLLNVVRASSIMQILINAADGQIRLVEVSPETTIAQLKSKLGALDSVVTYGARILDEDAGALSQYDVAHGSSLNINARLIGGKVHGSLARAGKVRAQTPKVEKQEKKKKKTGRAARRIQYNRRFVNVALSGPGRKRGPNSNAA